MYKVIRDFADLNDNRYVYRVGDEYPRSGISEISEDRIRELAGYDNNHGEPVIKHIPEPQVKPEPEPQKKRERKKNVGADS